MADITYCINGQCPFEDCERHLSKVSKAAIQGTGYVSVANYDGVCRRYISHLVDEQTFKRGKVDFNLKGGRKDTYDNEDSS